MPLQALASRSAHYKRAIASEQAFPLLSCVSQSGSDPTGNSPDKPEVFS